MVNVLTKDRDFKEQFPVPDNVIKSKFEALDAFLNEFRVYSIYSIEGRPTRKEFTDELDREYIEVDCSNLSADSDERYIFLHFENGHICFDNIRNIDFYDEGGYFKIILSCYDLDSEENEKVYNLIGSERKH